MDVVLTPRPGVGERLSRMIQLPTVSAELDTRGKQPFDDFVALLAELYPLVHERLSLEHITEVGLLYRWAGTSGADAPVVLMAHYDVVPVDESDPWTYPPFEGRIADDWVHGRGRQGASPGRARGGGESPRRRFHARPRRVSLVRWQ